MYILLVLCSTSVHLTFLNRKQLDDRDIGSPKRVPKQEIKRGRGRGRERKIEGGKREGEERGGREGGEGGEAQVMGLVDVTVRITGGSQSPEQLSRRDFPSFEYTNMFQYAHVFVYRSFILGGKYQIFQGIDTLDPIKPHGNGGRIGALPTQRNTGFGSISQVTENRLFVCPNWHL